MVVSNDGTCGNNPRNQPFHHWTRCSLQSKRQPIVPRRNLSCRIRGQIFQVSSSSLSLTYSLLFMGLFCRKTRKKFPFSSKYCIFLLTGCWLCLRLCFLFWIKNTLSLPVFLRTHRPSFQNCKENTPKIRAWSAEDTSCPTFRVGCGHASSRGCWFTKGRISWRLRFVVFSTSFQWILMDRKILLKQELLIFF